MQHDELSEIRALEQKIRELSEEAVEGPDQAAFQAQLNTHLLALVEHRAREAEAMNQALHDNLSELRRRKERMVTTVHDLKIPVTVSLLNLELAEAEEDTAVKEIHLNGIKRELEFLLETISNMLDLERPLEAQRQLKWEEVALAPLVNDVQARMTVLIKDKPELKLLNDVPENLPPLLCDRHLMMRVLTNLYSNAIKYTDRGSITVSAEVEPDRRSIVIAMRDTGSGIERGRQERLFDLFRGDPARYDSHGVGLMFVNSAVSMHGGRVWLESEQGKGTVIFVRMPLVR